jgi:hypothetical protein
MKKAEGNAQTMADVTKKNYGQAFQTGLKLQEEALQWWGAMLNRGGTLPLPDWRGPWTTWATLAGEAMSKTEAQIEEVAGLMEKNTRAAAELMEKATEAAQTPVLEDSQTKWLEVWALSVKAMQANWQAALQLSAQNVDSCLDLVRKGADFQGQSLKAA